MPGPTAEYMGKGNSESAQQKAFFMKCQENCTRIPFPHLLASSANGGKRGKATAAKMKAEGVKAGVPDISYSVPFSGYHGLFIEMKRPKRPGQSAGKMKPDQILFRETVLSLGYQHHVCYEYMEAYEVLLAYIGEGI